MARVRPSGCDEVVHEARPGLAEAAEAVGAAVVAGAVAAGDGAAQRAERDGLPGVQAGEQRGQRAAAVRGQGGRV